MLPRFEIERERHSRKMVIQGQKTGRSGSYADINEYMLASQEEKEDGF